MAQEARTNALSHDNPISDSDVNKELNYAPKVRPWSGGIILTLAVNGAGM